MSSDPSTKSFPIQLLPRLSLTNYTQFPTTFRPNCSLLHRTSFRRWVTLLAEYYLHVSHSLVSSSHSRSTRCKTVASQWRTKWSEVNASATDSPRAIALINNGISELHWINSLLSHWLALSLPASFIPAVELHFYMQQGQFFVTGKQCKRPFRTLHIQILNSNICPLKEKKIEKLRCKASIFQLRNLLHLQNGFTQSVPDL